MATLKQKTKMSFIPISFDRYVELHHKANPDMPRAEIVDALKDALNAYKQDARCNCGNPIWVIGSAFVGNACFTCITGESMPDEDYEIDDVCR